MSQKDTLRITPLEESNSRMEKKLKIEDELDQMIKDYQEDRRTYIRYSTTMSNLNLYNTIITDLQYLKKVLNS